MHIERLKLFHFRCFDNLEIEFGDKVNILVGNNAVGKTSIVEAIHYLGLVRSHRTNIDKELINFAYPSSFIKGNFKNDDKNLEILISLTDKGKKITMNNKPYNNISEYLGLINIVLFSPEDMELIKGSPATRRKFLDTTLSQIDNQYLNSSIKYRKLLKERNELLKTFEKEENINLVLLDVYTKGLIAEAKVIINKRLEFINLINPLLGHKTSSITNEVEKAMIIYEPSVEMDKIESSFKESLKNDLFYKTTTKGPHRDDFIININNLNAALFCSQGQQRTAVLGIKLALAEYINKKNKNMIIILDDVFSELDLNRQNEIIQLLNKNVQIFITTTSVENLSKQVLINSTVHNIVKEIV